MTDLQRRTRLRPALNLAPGAACLAMALLLHSAEPVGAQKSSWRSDAELGASLFFGSRSQTTVNTRLGTQWTGEALQVRTRGSFIYGEGTTADGDDFVNRRSWDMEGNFTYRPVGMVSPYFSAKLESSFERRIDRRYTTGAGGQLNVIRRDRTSTTLSFAALWEHTTLDIEPIVGFEPDPTLFRLSMQYNVRRTLGDERRVMFSSDGSYRPVYDVFSDFLFTSTSSLSYLLSRSMTLRLTFVDVYDSGAVGRGGTTNNEGQLFFSVASTF